MPVANPGAAYGWRARIGLLQPTLVADTNPFEFYLMAPAGVQLVLTSMGIQGPGSAYFGGTPRSAVEDRLQEYARAMDRIEEPIRRVLERGVDCIIQAGVPPITSRGWGYEEELKARVAKITDVPFASDIGCCIAAMRAVGIKRLALLVGDNLRDSLIDYLNHAQIETVVAQSSPQSGEASSESLAVQYRASVKLWMAAKGKADGVYIPIAARPSVGMIAALEQEIQAPVITSAQAMMWEGLRLAGVNPAEVSGYGRLFQA